MLRKRYNHNQETYDKEQYRTIKEQFRIYWKKNCSKNKSCPLEAMLRLWSLFSIQEAIRNLCFMTTKQLWYLFGLCVLINPNEQILFIKQKFICWLFQQLFFRASSGHWTFLCTVQRSLMIKKSVGTGHLVNIGLHTKYFLPTGVLHHSNSLRSNWHFLHL